LISGSLLPFFFFVCREHLRRRDRGTAMSDEADRAGGVGALARGATRKGLASPGGSRRSWGRRRTGVGKGAF